jgi:hypothetical protein
VRYMLLIYSDPSSYATMTEEEGARMMGEYFAFTQAIVESGEFLAGDPLQGVDTATTVRVSGGQHSVTDGPFAETKEVLGGYYLVDCADLDRALELATKIPHVRNGSVEVRPLQELGQA